MTIPGDISFDALFESAAVDAPTLAVASMLATMVKSPAAGEKGLRAAHARGTSRDAAIETALQAYLFAGFPRAISMLAVIADVWGDPAECPPERQITGDDVSQWRARGEKLFRQIYDKNADRVLRDLLRFHPELRDWIFVDAYGKVLGRPALDPRTRELAAVAALAASGDFRQLSSHVRGARHCGATRAEIFGVLDAIRPLIGDDAAARSTEIATRALPAKD